MFFDILAFLLFEFFMWHFKLNISDIPDIFGPKNSKFRNSASSNSEFIYYHFPRIFNANIAMNITVRKQNSKCMVRSYLNYTPNNYRWRFLLPLLDEYSFWHFFFDLLSFISCLNAVLFSSSFMLICLFILYFYNIDWNGMCFYEIIFEKKAKTTEY